MATHCAKCQALLKGSGLTDLCPACISDVGRSLWAEDDAAPLSDDYEILEEMARGGMGIVYRARQHRLDRLVALKRILNGRLSSAQAAERFRLEAEMTAKLDHPNIVPIYDFGERDGQLFYTMKLIEGAPLVSTISTRSARDSVEILTKVALAVHFAHQRGVLHRDLKPSNILIDTSGEPHLLDFGLAKALHDDAEADLTRSGDMLGSPAYMAPEQIAGDSHALTMATDVYGLGAILYEMLTGAPPFTGATALETMRKASDERPKPPSTHQRKTDRDLETICLKCLEKEPSKRYPSCLALSEDLQRWLGGKAITARPVSAWGQTHRWCRRNPVVAILLGICLLSVAVGTLSVYWQWRRERTQRLLAEVHLYAGDMLAVGTALEKHDYGAAKKFFQRPSARFASKPPRDRPWEMRATEAALRDEALHIFPAEAGKIVGLSFLPSGPLISASLDGSVRIFQPESWESVRSFRLTTSLDTLYVSDGQRIAIADDASKEIRFLDLTDLQEIHAFETRLDNEAQAALSAFFPDGKRFLHTHQGRGLIILALDQTTTIAPTRLTGVSPKKRLVLSPNGRAIAAFFPAEDGLVLKLLIDESGQWDASKNWLDRWETVGGLAPISGNSAVQLAFSQDAVWLGLAAGSEVHLVDVAAGEVVENHARHPAGTRIKALAFSHENNWLVSAGSDQTLRWQGLDPWQPLGERRGHDAEIQELAVNAEGLVASGAANGVVKLWDAPSAASFPEVSLERFQLGSDRWLTIEDFKRISVRELGKDEPVRTIDFEDRVADAMLLENHKHLAALLTKDGQRWIEVRDVFNGDLLVQCAPFQDDIAPMGANFDYPLMAHTRGTQEIICVANGNGQLPWTALAERSPYQIHRFNLNTGALLSTHHIELGIGSSCVTYTHSGTHAAWGGHDGEVVLVDLRTGVVEFPLSERHHYFVSDVQFSADDRFLATVGGQRVMLWETRTWTKVREISVPGQDLRTAAFHPSEVRLAIGGSMKSVILWDLEHDRQVGAFAPLTHPGDALFRLRFCGLDGDTLVGWCSGPTFVSIDAPIHLWQP